MNLKNKTKHVFIFLFQTLNFRIRQEFKESRRFSEEGEVTTQDPHPYLEDIEVSGIQRQECIPTQCLPAVLCVSIQMHLAGKVWEPPPLHLEDTKLGRLGF